jgi:hypothetical protein
MDKGDKMTCNIDKRGRQMRALIGIILLVGALLWHLAMPEADLWVHLVHLLVGLIGVFSIFQGLVGWCVVRAMGFKTPV